LVETVKCIKNLLRDAFPMEKEKGKQEGAFPGKRERKARRSFSWRKRKEKQECKKFRKMN